jgi:hypothetical protein
LTIGSVRDGIDVRTKKLGIGITKILRAEESLLTVSFKDFLMTTTTTTVVVVLEGWKIGG